MNNTLSYGSGYASAFIEWASNVADTKFRFSEQAVRLLIDYYLDGIATDGLWKDFGSGYLEPGHHPAG